MFGVRSEAGREIAQPASVNQNRQNPNYFFYSANIAVVTEF